ncbi:hypothetical protein E2C01_075454 [Portunus trituberculatus]|uniref:Uncharacterized protein n=1 Tax=Portunus trituberculatus TaxID=210409 RepID=A0A5B7I645_PORTR|nr:hypothetical protein [Portunus trituberculatus]
MVTWWCTSLIRRPADCAFTNTTGLAPPRHATPRRLITVLSVCITNTVHVHQLHTCAHNLQPVCQVQLHPSTSSSNSISSTIRVAAGGDTYAGLHDLPHTVAVNDPTRHEPHRQS